MNEVNFGVDNKRIILHWVIASLIETNKLKILSFGKFKDH